MPVIDLKPELAALLAAISKKNTYYGNRVPASIMALLTIEQTSTNQGILAPPWLPVLERGRGPRKSSRDSGLVNRIYFWMKRRGMFKSGTTDGQFREARFVTWYINKYGNQQFRNKVFIDIYTSERQKTIDKILTKYAYRIGEITWDAI